MKIEHPDYRTPMEKRRDEIKAKHGADAVNFTPDVLRLIANGPIYDTVQHYCPAGRLSMADAKAREASQILRDNEKEHGTNA